MKLCSIYVCELEYVRCVWILLYVLEHCGVWMIIIVCAYISINCISTKEWCLSKSERRQLKISVMVHAMVVRLRSSETCMSFCIKPIEVKKLGFLVSFLFSLMNFRYYFIPFGFIRKCVQF